MSSSVWDRIVTSDAINKTAKRLGYSGVHLDYYDNSPKFRPKQPQPESLSIDHDMPYEVSPKPPQQSGWNRNVFQGSSRIFQGSSKNQKRLRAAIRKQKQPSDKVFNLLTSGFKIPGVTIMAYFGEIKGRDGYSRSSWVLKCDSCGYLWFSSTAWLFHKTTTCFACNKDKVA